MSDISLPLKKASYDTLCLKGRASLKPFLMLSSALCYNALENICQQVRPPAGGRQFTHLLESSGPLAAFLVDYIDERTRDLD